MLEWGNALNFECAAHKTDLFFLVVAVPPLASFWDLKFS